MRRGSGSATSLGDADSRSRGDTGRGWAEGLGAPGEPSKEAAARGRAGACLCRGRALELGEVVVVDACWIICVESILNSIRKSSRFLNLVSKS